ncbi:MAG TPA: MFS transporter [Thermoplasmata archaeon]|nr:MFS transporter [Thermoplasmata archaeon]
MTVPEPAAPGTPSTGRPLLAVFSATFFVRFAFGITVAVLASYISGQSSLFGQQEVGVVGVVAALAPVGEFSTVLLSGAAADRYGRFPVLFGGIGSAAVIFVLISLTREPYLLAGANLLFGVSSGAILASSLAIVADHSATLERGLEMGRFDAMNLSGWIAGFAFGLGVKGAVPNSSLGLAFLLGSALLAGGLGFALLLLRGRPVDHGHPAYSFSEVARHIFRRSVLLVTLPWLVIYMLIGTALVFLGTAASGIGIPSLELAAIIGGAGFVLVLTQPTFGRLADRFGRMRMMTLGAAGFVMVMVLASFIVAFGPKVPFLVGLGVSVLAALAYGPAALAALADLSLEISRATTMAIYSLTISLGMLVGLLAFTQLFSRLGDLGLYIFFAAVAVTLVTLTVGRLADLRGAGGDRPTTPVR